MTESEYALAARAAADNIKTGGTTPIVVAAAGIRALTYALLDVAQAIRDHGRGSAA